MKKVLFLILVLVFVGAVFSQDTQKPFDLTEQGVRIEPDKRLMTVMAALEFAGMETPLSKNGQEFRLKLREDIKGVNDNLQAKMKAFINSGGFLPHLAHVSVERASRAHGQNRKSSEHSGISVAGNVDPGTYLQTGNGGIDRPYSMPDTTP